MSGFVRGIACLLAATCAAAPGPRPALAAASAGAASRIALDVTIASVHARHSLNDFNPGIGLEMRIAPGLSLAGGIYRNSYRRTSGYAVVGYTPWRLLQRHGWAGRLGVAAGLIGGYRTSEVRTQPLLAGLLFELRDPAGWGINLLGVPPAGHGSGFAGLQLVVPLGGG